MIIKVLQSAFFNWYELGGKGEQHRIRLLVGPFRVVVKIRSPREEKRKTEEETGVLSQAPPGPQFLVSAFISRSVDDPERDS